MVLPNKVGKQRPFNRGLLLTIVTFGIYGIYWQYKTHKEIMDQFELQKEGRDDGVIWFILGFVGLFVFPLLWILGAVYHHKFVENVQYTRQRLGLAADLPPMTFILWVWVAPFVALVVFGFFLIMSFAGAAFASGFGTEPALSFIVGMIGMIALIGFASAMCQIVGFSKLQRSINGIWDYYDERMAVLGQGGAAPAQPPLI